MFWFSASYRWRIDSSAHWSALLSTEHSRETENARGIQIRNLVPFDATFIRFPNADTPTHKGHYVDFALTPIYNSARKQKPSVFFFLSLHTSDTTTTSWRRKINIFLFLVQAHSVNCKYYIVSVKLHVAALRCILRYLYETLKQVLLKINIFISL